MALVMLPCDLPWWPMVQRHLNTLLTENCDHIATLQTIHNLCNVGLDPDERDSPDLTVFGGLETFLNEIGEEEKKRILHVTVPAIARRALNLKNLRPPNGLHFSLQQQQDRLELERDFVASLLAHMFFSTYPKRTLKTHPTLQDFNFTNFFKHLDHKYQRAKLRCFFHYFELLEKNGLPTSKIIFSRQAAKPCCQVNHKSPKRFDYGCSSLFRSSLCRRCSVDQDRTTEEESCGQNVWEFFRACYKFLKVMTSKQWLTIEDWLECGLPLCPLLIRHEGRLDRTPVDFLNICFCSARIGGQVLSSGSSRECIQMCICPEMLCGLLFTEALEDNEVLSVDGVMQVGRICDPRKKAVLEKLDVPIMLNVCCMDAENYSKLPLSQYEEDNFLREVNKALLAFRQHFIPTSPPPAARRLSPIGESFSSTPPEVDETANKLKSGVLDSKCLANVRRKFILLGSSGECLPVTRLAVSRYSSCHSDISSSCSEFHSARTSLGDDYEDDTDTNAHSYSGQLDTPERRCTFAQRLKEALCREQSTSSESSYAVGISVTGSSTADDDIRMRRGGSRGFMLEEDCSVVKYEGERVPIDNKGLYKRGNSSKYSFSTEYSSELEAVYEQLGRWLDESDNTGSPDGESDHQRLRDLAVIEFAGSLLKRTLSETFVGVPLTEGDISEQGQSGDESERRNSIKLANAARSLSLELARHKHKLAAQLVSVLGQKRVDSERNLLPVATGNWGCGSSNLGEPQLKLLIQWLAASVAGIPYLLYFTCSHYKLLKLDTVCRVILDRQWSVGELTGAVLRYLQATLDHPNPSETVSLFEHLIGSEDKQLPSSYLSSEIDPSDDIDVE